MPLMKRAHVPEFIAEVAAGDDGVFGGRPGSYRRATAENAETEGVGTVFGD